ncbi:hypothetical protein [Hyalangium versicolor]|uniref:hypothetical protein n=1 Tax=Hyalangium versicolor TaxID=2861190 RepID=UPI001CCB649B|nr:hypothetical protein [Hyalangium versicolor]
MRFMNRAVAIVAATTSLLGCGGNSQPSIYRVAVDTLSAQNMPVACYSAGNAPTTITDKVTNLVDEKQWVVWEGIDDTFYFEPGNINYTLADAHSVVISGDGISGSKNDDGAYVFTSERTQTASANEQYVTSAVYTIEELGKTLKGTLVLTSSCAGSNCAGTPSCSVTLNFSGRKIDGDRYFTYGSGSGG